MISAVNDYEVVVVCTAGSRELDAYFDAELFGATVADGPDGAWASCSRGNGLR
jgi:hypothetical protein